METPEQFRTTLFNNYVDNEGTFGDSFVALIKERDKAQSNINKDMINTLERIKDWLFCQDDNAHVSSYLLLIDATLKGVNDEYIHKK